MPDPRSFGGLLLGLGLVWLALGLRLGFMGLAQGLGPQGFALGTLILALGLLGVELLTRPAPLAPKIRRGLSMFPASFREEWGGDLAEACWQWRQCGYARWSIRLWTLGWILQLVETRMRHALYEAMCAPRWKKS